MPHIGVNAIEGQSQHAVIAQLAARGSHNPKVVSSILTHRSLRHIRRWTPGVLRCSVYGCGRETQIQWGNHPDSNTPDW